MTSGTTVTGLQDFFPCEKVSDDEYLDSRLKQIGVAPGDDPDQIKELRTAPEGSYQ